MGSDLAPSTYDVTYAFAFEGCIFSLFLIGEEVIGPAMMPIFMRELDDRGPAAAWRFAGTVLTLQLLVLAPVVAGLMLAPEWVVRIWTAWSPAHRPDLFEQGCRSVRSLAPALIGLSVGSTTYVLLNGHKRFFLAAFGDAVWKFAAAGALLAGVAWLGGAEALIWGLVAGSVLKVGTHLVGLRDQAGRLRPGFAFGDPAMRRLYWLALPLLAGIVFAKVRDVVNNVYVLSEIDTAGLMQANSMGRKLQGTIHFLVPYAFSIAVFPFLCELVDRRDHAQLGEVVTRSGRMLLALFVPAVAVIAVLAGPLTALLFQGGRFDEPAVQRTAVSTALYTLALPAAAIEALVMQAFFAHRRMVAITAVGILFSSLSMALSGAGLWLFRGSPLLLLGAIAGGFALTRTLKSLVLVRMLRSSAPGAFPPAETFGFLARLILAAVLMAAVAWLAAGAAPRAAALAGVPLAGRLLDLLRLGTGAAAAMVVGAGACVGLRIHEPFELAGWALARLRARQRKA
jgi:putative peptidoglycan lipid II flippase